MILLRRTAVANWRQPFKSSCEIHNSSEARTRKRRLYSCDRLRDRKPTGPLWHHRPQPFGLVSCLYECVSFSIAASPRIDEALIENRLMREANWSQSYKTTFVFSVSRLLSRRRHSISAIPGHCAWLNMPSVDFRYAMGSPCGSLSPTWDTRRTSRGKSGDFPVHDCRIYPDMHHNG